MSFRITGLPAETFNHLFALSEEELAKRGAVRRIADDRKTGYPCQVSLTDSKPGDELLLVTRKLWMPAAPAKGTRPVTREEVALHNTRDDCWIIISGKVYDITEWAPHHPGGAGIARMYAGKEATAEFGDYHSAEAVAHMAHFCIGDLVETPPPCCDWPG